MTSLNTIETHNLNEIQRLNQRGGRMLSIIDLLLDGTLNLEMAGLLTYLMLHNPSFLTGANPGGTGKTTLMASLLNLLKPGIKIKSVTEEELDKNIFNEPKTKSVQTKYLAHEIGDGPYYSYLWGEKAKRFLELAKEKSRTIASCIHADTLQELEETLRSELNLKTKSIQSIELLLFMRMKGSYGNRIRRVSHLYEFSQREKEYRLLYEWKDSTDHFEKQRNSHLAEKIAESEEKEKEEEIVKYSNFLSKLKKEKTRKIGKVRKRLLSFLN